jgi:hypothetical protein
MADLHGRIFPTNLQQDLPNLELIKTIATTVLSNDRTFSRVALHKQ